MSTRPHQCALQTANDRTSRALHAYDITWVDERGVYLCRGCRAELGLETEATSEEESGGAQR